MSQESRRGHISSPNMSGGILGMKAPPSQGQVPLRAALGASPEASRGLQLPEGGAQGRRTLCRGVEPDVGEEWRGRWFSPMLG